MKFLFTKKLSVLILFFFLTTVLVADDARSQLSLLGLLYGGSSDKRGLSRLLGGRNQPGDVKDGILYVNAMLLEYLKPYNTYNEGSVDSISTITVPFSKSGIISYIVGKRNFVFGTVFDNEGELLYPGTIIASLDEQDYQFRLDLSKRRREVVDKSTQYAKKMEVVQEKLAKKKYITSFQMDEAQIALMTNLMEYETSLRETDDILLKYKTPNMYSNFSGIVSQVYSQIGDEVLAGSPAIELMQIDPVKIKIKCPNALLNMSSGTERAFVYTDENQDPIEVKVEVFQEDPDNVYLYVKNRAITTSKLSRSQKNMKKIFSTHKIKNLLNPQINAFFLPENRKKSVVNVAPVEAIRKDQKGFYILKIERGGENLINKLTATEVKIKKIYIKRGKVITTTPMDTYDLLKVQSFTTISKDDILNPGDVIVGYSDQGLNDGDEAVIVDVKWLLFPGNKVKVSFPKFTFPGIYVPSSSIIHKGEDDNYIYTIDHDMLKLKKVYIIGFFRNYSIIKSPEIKIGDKMLLLEDFFDPRESDLFDKLYDGRKVNIIETQEGPKFIEFPHAFNYKSEQMQDNSTNKLPFSTGTGSKSLNSGLSKRFGSLKSLL